MEKLYKFELTEQETNLVLTALSELPFKVSNGLIQKMVASANHVEVVKLDAEPVEL